MPAGGGKPLWAGIAHHERFSLIWGFAGSLIYPNLIAKGWHSMETNHVISHQTLINILNDLLPFKYFHILLLSFLYIIFNYNNT
ncbi:hypothetical protein, partial [Moraxella lacunata]|uniref:hypothetical protein n=1 Tax=Moraxella lacunata TaxID=477 RepID=UPI001C129E9C